VQLAGDASSLLGHGSGLALSLLNRQFRQIGGELTRPLVAVFILSVAHAIWHLPLFFTDEPPVPGAFLIGLISGGVVLAWLWNSTGTIVVPILLHGANNTAEQAFQLGFTHADAAQLQWYTAAGWAVAALVVIWRTHGTLGLAGARPVTVPIHEQRQPAHSSADLVSAS